MAIILAQVAFDRLSGVPEDRVINTFHFSTPAASPLPADLDRINTMVGRFYNLVVNPPGNAVDFYLSNFLATPYTITLYNMDLPAPRVPLRQTSVNWIPVLTGINYPAEVAGVLSYRADPQPGIPLRNTRGRLYIGPLRNVAGADLSTDNRPTTAYQQTLAGAAARLVVDGETPGAVWIMYSPTRRARGQAPFFWTVEGGFVDNAWDTQRRRGRDAVSRLNW